ncbi:MAG: sigma 54-interacting transcriptional regulator [Planctomycetota bacterium]
MSERATRDRIGLLRAALALTQERDVEKLLARIMDEVTRVLDADRSTLFLYDSERRELFSKIAQRAEVTEIRLPIGRGLAGHVCKTGTAMAVDDVYDDPRFTPETDRSTGYRTKTVACAPLLTPDGRTVGVLEVMNKREGVFDPDDVKLLTAFAAFSAVAIENARLYDEDARKSMQIQALNRQLKDALEKQTKRLANVEQELETSKRELGERFQARNIVGRAPAMLELQRLVDRVAATDAPILIQGESGTGKELLAKAIHFGSRRAGAEFVAENCAAVAETLLEAELFGHKKGAFTGADRDRQGLFEIASGGTLFLDEVGDMSLEMQKKLLRALQEGEIRPVGARDNRKVDVRILAATNRDLDVMMKEGTFREDLYYRLNVVRLRLPALRERREDIPILVEFFLDQIAKESGRPRASVSDRAMKALVRHSWPGNVRELQNEIRRAAIMADGLIDPEHLSPQVLGSAGADGVPTGGTLKGAKLSVERKMIEAALKRTGGNVAAAARELGVHRPQLSVLIGKHGLKSKGEEA